MENDKNKNFMESLQGFFNMDKLITKEQADALQKSILELLIQFKKDNISLNKETKKMVDDLLTKLLNKYDKQCKEIEDAKKDVAETKKTIEKDAQDRISEMKYLIQEFKKMKPKNGESPDADKIIQEVFERMLALPKDEKEEMGMEQMTPEEIIDAINSTEDNEENKISWDKIAFPPEYMDKNHTGGMRSPTVLQQATDFDFSTRADGYVIAWDATKARFKMVAQSGGGGGGSQTLADTSTYSTDATKSTYTMTDTVDVVFKDAGGNAVLTIDETNDRIIVGATATDNTAISSSIALVKNGLAFMQAFGYGNAGSSGGFFTGYAAVGTAGSPSAVTSGSTLVALSGRGYDGTAWTSGSQSSILLQSSQNWSNTARGTKIVFNTTPNDSTTNTAVGIFDNNGNFNVGNGTGQNARLGIINTRSSAYFSSGGVGLTAYDGTFTDTSSSGTVSLIRTHVYGIQTYAASSVTTYTTATSVYIAGAPTAGTNVTITNALAFHVASGTSRFAGSVHLSALTASRILATDSNSNIQALDTTTYPSLSELAYLKGVTSAIQTQIDAKQATITGGASTIVSSDLTANRALISNGSGKVAVSTVTDTELGYVSGVTSAIQTQLNTKITASSSDTLTNKTINASNNTISNLTTAMFATNVVDTDTSLSANSDTRLASQKAVKSYVDNYITGLAWKQAVRVATAVAGTLASSFENGDTVDGVVLATGDRILIKNQVTQTENGIYIVQASGAPARSGDADTGVELVSATVFVKEGTTNADTQWTCTNNDTITIGSTNITFAQVSGAGTYTNGTGLTLTGNVFAIDSTVATLTGLQALTNKTYNGLTLSATTGTFTLTNGKTFAVSNTLTFTGTDSSSVAFGTGGTVAYTANNLGVFATSTSATIGVGTIELGHATDTTIARLGAGDVGIEGVSILTASNTKTVTNKRNQPRVYSTANNTSLTPEIDTYDIFHLTAMSGATTINNHSTSTPADGEQMRFRFLDNGTARALSWGTNYVAKAGVTLPTTTVLGKNLIVLFEWNANLSKWNCLATGQEA